MGILVRLPKTLSSRQREVLEKAAQDCPVRRSLHADIALSFEFKDDL